MKKVKSLLPIYLILSLIILISTVVVSLTAGINLGIDFVGGKQIEVKVPEGNSTENYYDKINGVLDDYGLTINTSFTEDKYTDTYYVVKINTREISTEKAFEIRQKLATELDVNEENVSEILSISGNVKQQTVINIGLTVLGIFAILFVTSWVRYGIMEGLGMLFGAIHNMIISFAAIVLTRIELTVSTCAAIAVVSILFVAIFASILERAREKLLMKQNKDMSTREIYLDCHKKSLFVTTIVLSGIVVFAIASLFVPSTIIKLFALSSIVCAIVAFYSTIVSTYLTGYLAEAKSIRTREKLSKNKTN